MNGIARARPAGATPTASGPPRVLILGGSSEAVALARRLHERTTWSVVTSLAGRTAQPRTLPGRVRTGGFGGPQGLARWLASEHVDAVVDATHPCAPVMPHQAHQATLMAGIPRLRLCRAGWQPGPGDRWSRVGDVEAAADALAALDARRAFLALGRQALVPFARVPGTWFLVRSIEAPDPPLTVAHELVLDRGPFHPTDELDLMASRRIDTVVTRDSGGDATAAKLEAARQLGISVVVVDRPPGPPGPQAATVDEAVGWCMTALALGRHAPAPGAKSMPVGHGS